MPLQISVKVLFFPPQSLVELVLAKMPKYGDCLDASRSAFIFAALFEAEVVILSQ